MKVTPEKIRAWRKSKGLTQVEAAAKMECPVHPITWNRWETGTEKVRKGGPYEKMLIKLLRA